MSIEAMKMALEALEQLQGGCTDSDDGTVEAITVWCPEVIDALRQAIEQAEQAQPVGKFAKFSDGVWKEVTEGSAGVLLYTSPPPLYTAPVDGVTISEERVDETAERKHMTDLASVGEVGVWGEREWVGLKAEEIWQCNTAPAGHHVEYHICVAHQNMLDFAEAIEAKLKEKNA